MIPGDEWPEAPWYASYHDGRGLLEWLSGWRGHGWSVPEPPPGPFPFISGPYPRARYGPPGTAYVFSEADMFANLVDVPEAAFNWAVKQALRKLGATFGEGSLIFWRVPPEGSIYEGGPMTFRWLRTTIVGTIGTTEGVSHVLNWRPATNPDQDMSDAQVQTFGDAVRDAWVNFFSGNTNIITNSLFSKNLVYTEVRTAYMEQGAPASFTTHQGKRGPVKDFHYPRATYLVPTKYSAIAPGAAAGQSNNADLPWEVACCLSLTTGQRGPRNRGRLYLGPLAQNAMATNGMFGTGIEALVPNFRSLFANPLNASSGQKLMIVSRTYATALPVTGVTVGHTPDSQRRRRKKQPEVKIPTQALA